MAGLLGDIGDTIFGDTETKDEFGQTERDRRIPIWSGLIKAGLLAYAGGGKLMPEDRARYYAEAGGALAGIPNDMLQAAQSNAQNKLRGQQLQEGRQKLVDRDQVRAMASSPEVQAALAKASGPDRLAIQLAIKSGDLHALTTAVGNLDKSGLNADRLQLATDKFNFAKEQKDAKSGTYTGNTPAVQHLNNLKNAPIDSYEYFMAHQFFSADQKNPDGTTVGKIDLSKFPDPTFVDPRSGRPPTVPPKPDDTKPPPEVPPGTPMTPEVVAQIGATLKPNEERVVNGVTISKDVGGIVSWDTGSDTKEGPRYRLGPKGVETLPPMKPPTPGEMNAFKNITTILKIEEALKDMEAHPNMVLGAPALVGDAVLQRADPAGNRTRSHISDLGSVTIHERSGAAVSPTEMARLNFIPRVTDSPPEIKRKLEALKQFTDQETRSAYETIGRDTRVPANIRQRYGGGAQPQAGGAGAKGRTPVGKGDKGQDIYRWSNGKLYEEPEP